MPPRSDVPSVPLLHDYGSPSTCNLLMHLFEYMLGPLGRLFAPTGKLNVERGRADICGLCGGGRPCVATNFVS